MGRRDLDIYSSDVIAAIDQAIRDGVDVISLSLGLSIDDDDDGDAGLENDPIAVAAFAAIKKNVFVVASCGNDGPYYWSLINGAPWIMTVGAGTIGREFQGTLTLGNGVSFDFPSMFPEDFPSVQFPVTYIESCNVGNQTLANRIIVCNENVSIGSRLQVQQAKSTGAAALVLITEKLLEEQDTIGAAVLPEPKSTGAATTAVTLDNPLAVGAGQVSVNRVLDPGLIYDTTPQDFINFLCNEEKKSRKMINIITRSNISDACKNPSPYLNYPSIIAYFTSDQSGPKIFRRTLTNVGEAKRGYTVRVRGLKGLNVVVEPKRLMFSGKNERLSYTVRLETPIALRENVIYGLVSWVDDEDAEFEVSCSVVATSLAQES